MHGDFFCLRDRRIQGACNMFSSMLSSLSSGHSGVCCPLTPIVFDTI